jgi:hypothetical protein
LGKTLAGENPKEARTLLCGRGSRLIPRSPGKLCTISTQRFCLVVSASETNCRSPVVFRAAAETAKKKRFSGQYTTAEIGHAASKLQKGQRAIWGPCVEIRGAPEGPRSRAASGCWCCSGSKSCRGRSRQRKAAGECEGEGATTLNVERQDAANVVWAARAAEVGRTGSRGAQSPDCRRLAKPECRGKKKPQITREK